MLFEEVARMAEAEDLHEHVHVLGLALLRLHATKVTRNISEDAGFVLARECIHVLLPWLHVGGGRAIKEHLQSQPERVVDAARSSCSIFHGEGMEPQGIVLLHPLVVRRHLRILPIQGDFLEVEVLSVTEDDKQRRLDVVGIEREKQGRTPTPDAHGDEFETEERAFRFRALNVTQDDVHAF